MKNFIDIIREAHAPLAFIAYHGAQGPVEQWESGETYFARDPQEAASYCRVTNCIIYKCEISFQNPYRTSDYDEFASAFDFIPEMKLAGYDGVIFGQDKQFMVFEPAQIEVLKTITDRSALAEDEDSSISVNVPEKEHYRFMRGGCYGFAIVLMRFLKGQGYPAKLYGLFDPEDHAPHHAFVVVQGKAYDCRGEMPLDAKVIGEGSAIGDGGIIAPLSIAKIKEWTEISSSVVQNCERMMRFWCTVPLREQLNDQGQAERTGPNTIIVYHGDEKEQLVLHSKMFFSTCARFAADYGKHITKWELNTMNIIDSLDPDLIEEILPIHDPYDEVEITDISDYMDRSSDTWEMLERDNKVDDLVHLFDAAGIIIYEGGIPNYLVYNTSVLKPL